MSKSQLRSIGVGMFLIGIIGLVGYALYITNFSGAKLGAYTIQKFDGSVLSLGGFRMSSGKTVAEQSVGPFMISPDMNPLRAILNIKQKGGPSSFSGQGIDYAFDLIDQQGESVWQKTGTYRESSSGDAEFKSATISMGTFEVEQAGDYILLCDLKDKRTFKPVITNAEVVFRRNVAIGNTIVYVIAGCSALIGFIFLLITSDKRQIN